MGLCLGMALSGWLCHTLIDVIINPITLSLLYRGETSANFYMNVHARSQNSRLGAGV